MIKRIFHPIGQGAFYSERHENFNMVFDCGSLPKNKKSEMLVKQSFKKNEDVIDLLFISHFDADHVNKIEVLKNHCANIKIVVLPLLRSEEKILLINFYNIIDKSIIPLITNPNQFFGKKTKIIFVKPSENEEINSDLELNTKSLKNNQEIESGTKIQHHNWVYIPYNYEYNAINQDLLNLFLQKNNSIDISKLKSDLTYSITNRAKLREIYNKLKGNINQNSMFLYSGPLKGYNKLFIQRYQKSFFPFSFLNYFIRKSDRISCIYTGDGNLNKVRINIVYKKYWNNVGTIQIPHHGDIKAYNSTSISDKSYYCPISVGSNNNNGHPSTTVIADLIGINNIPVQITEDINDLYFEIIK